jgi:hypothetical protein
MTAEAKTKWKDTLSIVATTINIVLSLGVILGGMKWITEVNTNMATVTSAVNDLKQRVDRNDSKLNLIDLRHAGEDAVHDKTLKLPTR